jgi:hypothetical protein
LANEKYDFGILQYFSFIAVDSRSTHTYTGLLSRLDSDQKMGTIFSRPLAVILGSVYLDSAEIREDAQLSARLGCK